MEHGEQEEQGAGGAERREHKEQGAGGAGVLQSTVQVSRSSRSQEILWFPFTELVVLTHTSEMDRLSWASPQPLVSQVKLSQNSSVFTARGQY